MLTLFTIPKPFHGHIGIIQENAIRSWMQLGIDISIILLGDEVGTKNIANTFGLKHITGVARNKYGTPLLNDVFAQAECASDNQYMGYANSDIILLQDFRETVERIIHYKKPRFLMVGQRTDFDCTTGINFQASDWELKLRNDVSDRGNLHKPTGIDYFIYRKGMWDNKIPAFAIGRFSWDNWLIYRTLQLKIPVIDATSQVLAVHQNHDYNHARGGLKGAKQGPEAKLNYALAGGMEKSYTIWDSTHVIDNQGLHIRDYATSLGGGIWSYRRNKGKL